MVIGWCLLQSGRVKVLTVRMPSPTLEPPWLPWQLSANNVHVTWVTKLQGGSASRGRAHFLQLKGRLSAGPSFCPSCDLFHVLYLFSPIQTVWKVPKVEVWNEPLTASQSLKQTWTWLPPSSSCTSTSPHSFPIMLQDLNTMAFYIFFFDARLLKFPLLMSFSHKASKFDAGVDQTNEPARMRTEGYHFLWCLRSRGGVYQSFCEIMGLDSSETWPLVETLLQGYQGSSGWAGALMGSIHIQSLIYLEIRPFSSTKLYPFPNFHQGNFFFPSLIEFFQKEAQLESLFPSLPFYSSCLGLNLNLLVIMTDSWSRFWDRDLIFPFWVEGRIEIILICGRLQQCHHRCLLWSTWA